MKTTRSKICCGGMLAILVLRSKALLRGVVLVLALGLATVSLAAEDTWTKKADMPTRRYVLSSGVVDGKIYAIGGALGNNSISTVEQYDPAMDTWTRKANMPMVRAGGASSVVNGRIYAIGGRPSTYGANISSVIEYDATTDTWTTKADMPTARCGLAACVVDGKIYAIGGGPGNYGVTSKVEQYDPATDTWTKKASMQTPRFVFAADIVNEKIYAVGGYGYLSSLEEYDPVADIWTTRAPMPTARAFLSTGAVNGKIYAIGGCANPYNSSELSSMEAYDPATDTWTKMPDMQVRRKSLASAAVNGKIYAIGGVSGAGWDPVLSTVEEYDPNPLVVDFNGDGKVDIKDLLRLIESWGQDDPMCDIAPRPFGDGIVDVLDLELLMSYWGQEVDDPTLIAHWALDETEGDIAYDSANAHDGTVHGDLLWLPDGGAVDGALQLDGADDYVSAPFVLDPSKGPFSVFAWIKGGAPGQVVLSQIDGANWLSADPSDGKVMTSLSQPAGRTAPPPLVSEFVITDGLWHRVGFVWDGSYRTLYVDDIEVAIDTQVQTGMASADGGLHIGAGKNLDAGSFFSGLIDDVRIRSAPLRTGSTTGR